MHTHTLTRTARPRGLRKVGPTGSRPLLGAERAPRRTRRAREVAARSVERPQVDGGRGEDEARGGEAERRTPRRAARANPDVVHDLPQQGVHDLWSVREERQAG